MDRPVAEKKKLPEDGGDRDSLLVKRICREVKQPCIEY